MELSGVRKILSMLRLNLVSKYVYLSYIHNLMRQYQIWNLSFMRDCPIKI